MISDDLETMLNNNTKTFTVEALDETISEDKTIQRADKSASLADLFEMISKLVTQTLAKTLNVDFVPDEQIEQLNIPDAQINKNYITFKVKDRVPKKELKSRVRESVKEISNDGSQNRSGIVYGQRFKSTVQFNILSPDYKVADEIMEKFEEMIIMYTGYLKKNGIAEIIFKKQIEDKTDSIIRQKLSTRSIQYYVETERLTVIFKEKVKEVLTNLSNEEE